MSPTMTTPFRPSVDLAPVASALETWSQPLVKDWMLVGFDGTEESAAALRWAADQNHRFGGVVPATAWRYPAWAIGRPPAGAPIAWPESQFVRHSQNRAASVLRRSDVVPAAEHLVIEQAAGPMLVEHSGAAQLLVVGTRRRRLSKLRGTVGGHCIARSAVPVVVVPHVKHHHSAHGRVIVGIDDSPEACAALSWAIDHTPTSQQIHVIHVSNSAGDSSKWLRQTIADARLRAAEKPSAPITGQISSGPPASTLRLASIGADMLVVGRRGRGRVAHALVGSVTTSLCQDLVVPTVVVPLS